MTHKNHSWEKVTGRLVKGEILRRRCKRCGIQVRKIRRGSVKPHGGWIEVQYRQGDSGIWQLTEYGGRGDPPKCHQKKICQACDGTGFAS